MFQALLAGMRNRENSSPCQGNGEPAGRGKNFGSVWPGEEEPGHDVSTPSYKKPLYGISHKIMEKKNPPANAGGTRNERLIPWRRKWQPTPVFLPGKSRGQRSLVGYSLWGRRKVGHDLAAKHIHKCIQM